MRIRAKFIRDGEWWVAWTEDVPGAITDGATLAEARTKLLDEVRSSKAKVQALRARGVPVEYIVKEDEGHGFVKPANRLDVYRAVERFLAEHLGGRRG